LELLAPEVRPVVCAKPSPTQNRPYRSDALDEMVVKIGGRRKWLSRADDGKSQVLYMLDQKKRITDADTDHSWTAATAAA
jgi:transposase-like protein